MASTKGAAYTPDAAKATDATIDLSERDEAARKLVRGERVREAAKDALLRSAESHDERDTGSQLPGEVAERARDTRRAMRRLAGMRRQADADGNEDAETHAEAQSADATGADDAAVVKDDGDTTTLEPQQAPRASRRITQEPARTTAFASEPAEGQAGLVVVTDAESEAAASESSARALAPKAGPKSATRRALPPGKATSATGVTPTPTVTHSRTAARRTVSDIRRSTERQAVQRAILANRRAGIMQVPSKVGHVTSVTARSAGSVTATATEGVVAAMPVALAALVLILLALVLATVLMGAAVDEDQRAGAHRLAQTATDEYLLGEANGDWNHKGAKYSEYVRGPYGARGDWDACLVGWCMRQAGFVDSGLTDAYGDTASYVEHFRESPDRGEVHDWNGDTYVPVEGDLFVGWYEDGTQHIGIVTGCDGSAFTTVEGDVEGGPNGTYDLDEEDGLGGYVAQRTRTLGEYSYTFIHPYYSDDAAAKV